MKKFIFKVIIFLLILAFVFSGLNQVFKEFNFYEKTIKEYKDREENIDVAIFGSSHGYNSYDVRLLEVKLNLNTFNFAGTAQRLETTQVILDKVISDNDLKLIIVDLFSMTINGMKSENSKNLQLRTLDYLSLSQAKVEQSRKIFGSSYLPYALFPFFRNHNQIKKIDALKFSRDYKLNNNTEYYKGFMNVNWSFNDNTWSKFIEKYKNKKEDENFNSLSQIQKNRIDKIIEIAKVNSIPILFVNSPSYVNSYDKDYKKTTTYISNYLNKRNLDFVDFDHLRETGKLDYKDFYDPNHLNISGARKITDSLVEYLVKNYRFEKKVRQSRIFLNNKFFHLKTNFKGAKALNLLNANNYKGIKKIALIKSSSSRIELIFESDSTEVLPIKLDIGLTKFQLKKLFYKDKMYIKENRYFNWGKLNEFNSFSYNGKNYKSIQFYFPFDYIKNIKVFLGKNANIKILDKSNIEL